MVEMITSLAALLWPLLLLTALLLLRKPLMAVVHSAEQREWTLEVGGQKVSMGQLNGQQNMAIADLQAQISALHERIAELRGSGVDGRPSDSDIVWDQTAPREGQTDPVPHAVLWVDDCPANNALIVEQLQRNGVRVDLAASTAEGMAKLGERRYGAVLSDIGRAEDNSAVPDAGIRLLRAVRETSPTIPFLIYSGFTAARTYQAAATSAGANVITSSPAVLADQLRSLGLL